MAKKEKKENKKTEVIEKSKVEKIYTSIVLVLAVIALAIVLIVFLPKDKKENELTKKYEYLPYETVYTIIDVDDLKEKIQNNNTFYVVVCNEVIDDGKYFMNYVNEAALEKEIKEIYYLDSSDLKSSEKVYLKIELDLGNDVLDEANIVYFEGGKPMVQTYSAEKDSYDNCWTLVLDFFNRVDLYIEEQK